MSQKLDTTQEKISKTLMDCTLIENNCPLDKKIQLTLIGKDSRTFQLLQLHVSLPADFPSRSDERLENMTFKIGNFKPWTCAEASKCLQTPSLGSNAFVFRGRVFACSSQALIESAWQNKFCCSTKVGAFLPMLRSVALYQNPVSSKDLKTKAEFSFWGREFCLCAVPS